MVRKNISPWLIVLLVILAGFILNELGVFNFSDLFSAGSPGVSTGSSGGGGLI